MGALSAIAKSQRSDALPRNSRFHRSYPAVQQVETWLARWTTYLWSGCKRYAVRYVRNKERIELIQYKVYKVALMDDPKESWNRFCSVRFRRGRQLQDPRIKVLILHLKT